MFDKIEIDCLIMCLKEYRHTQTPQLKRSLHNKLCDSCLKKLSRFTDSTEFDRQEYSVMCFAVDSMCSLPVDSDDNFRSRLISLRGKLNLLARI